MTRWITSFGVTAVIAIASLSQSPAALAHGGDIAGGKATSEEAQIALLAQQPARVLAQQALVTLQVRNDVPTAAIRLDAALESTDQADIDVALLKRATETLDGGDPRGAIPLLDEALSRPLGADRGKALHEAGREFTPEIGAQEVVATVAGGLLLLLGAFALWRAARARRDERPSAA